MPQLLAHAQPQRALGLIAPGSPIRYYAPAAPLALGATTVTLVNRWHSGGDRRLITATAGSTAAAAGLTAYLIRSVNLRLLASDEPLSAQDRDHLVAHLAPDERGPSDRPRRCLGVVVQLGVATVTAIGLNPGHDGGW